MSSEPQESDRPVYTASAVAARLGVAVETLRTWDRRYGLGPGTRGPGGRRRYGEEDLARLLVMRRLVTSGMPTSEAARRAAGGGGGVPPVGIDEKVHSTRQGRPRGGRVPEGRGGSRRVGGVAPPGPGRGRRAMGPYRRGSGRRAPALAGRHGRPAPPGGPQPG